MALLYTQVNQILNNVHCWPHLLLCVKTLKVDTKHPVVLEQMLLLHVPRAIFVLNWMQDYTLIASFVKYWVSGTYSLIDTQNTQEILYGIRSIGIVSRGGTDPVFYYLDIRSQQSGTQIIALKHSWLVWTNIYSITCSSPFCLMFIQAAFVFLQIVLHSISKKSW